MTFSFHYSTKKRAKIQYSEQEGDSLMESKEQVIHATTGK